jgi:hypothetical protein
MAAINGKTGGIHGRRRAAALAVVAAVATLTAACGVVHIHVGSSAGSASTGPGTYQADLAYAHCMQTHGVPDFPDPNPSRGLSISGQPQANSPAARANDACKHLLPTDSTETRSVTAPTTASPSGDLPGRVWVLRAATDPGGLPHPAAADQSVLPQTTHV